MAPFYWLLGIAAATVLLAFVDALQEGVPGITFVLQVTFCAVIAQLPGLLCGRLHCIHDNRYTFIFLIPAFFIAVVSLLIYVLYVLAGQVQTAENAGQMHVVFMPIMLVMLAVASYFVSAVAAGVNAIMQWVSG